MEIIDNNSFAKPDLREELAIDRTYLANERTLLAYLRSGVSLILAGVTFIHFSQEIWFRYIGIACIPVGAIVLYVGSRRYIKIYRQIKSKCLECRI